MNYDCICFGEVLFDVLPTEKKAGGAPMNVAYHLSKLGIKTSLISKIGNDENGKQLLAILKEKKLDISNIKTGMNDETGVVIATPDASGDMNYLIKENAAWDFIDGDSTYGHLVNDTGYFIFGSLAARQTVTRNTLFNLLDTKSQKVFDINLRKPFIHQRHIEHQLLKADILKMNCDELNIVSAWYNKLTEQEDQLLFLQDKFQIPTIITTCGAAGALVNTHGAFFYNDGIAVAVADTIGSGDSFLAGFISKVIQGAETREALEFAGTLGAFVATQSGGCPDYEVVQIEHFKKQLNISHRQHRMTQK